MNKLMHNVSIIPGDYQTLFNLATTCPKTKFVFAYIGGLNFRFWNTLSLARTMEGLLRKNIYFVIRLRQFLLQIHRQKMILFEHSAMLAQIIWKSYRKDCETNSVFFRNDSEIKLVDLRFKLCEFLSWGETVKEFLVLEV